MMQPKMLDFYKRLLMAASDVGIIASTTMNDHYVSIDIADGNDTYLLTVMLGKKEDNENDPV